MRDAGGGWGRRRWWCSRRLEFEFEFEVRQVRALAPTRQRWGSVKVRRVRRRVEAAHSAKAEVRSHRVRHVGERVSDQLLHARTPLEGGVPGVLMGVGDREDAGADARDVHVRDGFRIM